MVFDIMVQVLVFKALLTMLAVSAVSVGDSAVFTYSCDIGLILVVTMLMISNQ